MRRILRIEEPGQARLELSGPAIDALDEEDFEGVASLLTELVSGLCASSPKFDPPPVD